MEKISVQEARKRYGPDEKFCDHPNTLIAEYGDPYPFLQNLSQILNTHGLKLIEVDDRNSDICLAIEKNC